MSNVSVVLELSSLPTRHPPIGEALLQVYAPSVIVRLRDDPTQQLPGTMSRRIEVDWCKRPGRGSATQVHRDIGWAGVLKDVARVCEQLPFTKNAHDLTEEAAVGIAALLINDLEEGVLQNVLPIGSGGDYFVRVKEASSPIQLEVSGLKEDGTGSASHSRLREKTDQVLKHARVGFVSVTTFLHGSGAIVHGYFHYVKKTRGGKKPSGKGKQK